MKRLLALVLWVLLLLPTIVLAQSTQQLCYTTDGNNCQSAFAASNSAKVSIASAATTEIVALSTTKYIFVTSFDLVSTAAQTAKFVYGSGTACATGATDLTGAYGMSTFTVITKGTGMGSILFVPYGKALCITTTTTGQLSGSVSYVQF